MSFEVRVAVITSGYLPAYLPPLHDQGFEMPYWDRLAVTLEVSSDESLADVHRRAIEAFDPQVDPTAEYSMRAPVTQPHWAWFYEPGDDEGPVPSRGYDAAEDLITLDPQGRARFNRSSEEILYGDIVRAAEADLLHGADPYRPYLVLVHPQGDAGFVEAIQPLVDGFRVLADLLAAAEMVRLARSPEARQQLIDVLLRGGDALKRNQDKFDKVRAGPREVLTLALRTPWTPQDLQAALDLNSPQDATDTMLALGFQAKADGTFQVSDQWGSLLPAAAEAIALGRVDFERTLEEQLAFLIQEAEAGRLPPPDWPSS